MREKQRAPGDGWFRRTVVVCASVVVVLGSLGLVSVNTASAGPAEECQAVRDRDHAIYLQLVASLPPGSPVPPEIVNPCLEAPSTTPTTLAPPTFDTPTPGQAGGGIGYGADVPHTGTLSITMPPVPGQPPAITSVTPQPPTQFASEEVSITDANGSLLSEDKVYLNSDGKNGTGSDTFDYLKDHDSAKRCPFVNTALESNPNLSEARRKAVEYAERYAVDPNGAYDFFDGSDCTNFASQVLRAGGMGNIGPGIDDIRGGDSNDWYQGDYWGPGKDYSTTWTLARENHNFMTQHSHRGTIVGIQRLDTVNTLTYDPLAPSKAGLQPGDLIYYKNHDGTINHAAVYVGQVRDVNGNLVDVVDQHSVAERCLKHGPWTPDPMGNYVGGPAQAEFVRVSY
ncbi:MAG: amidase domain-containing protein [Mycobacteriaceae bacterium]